MEKKEGSEVFHGAEQKKIVKTNSNRLGDGVAWVRGAMIGKGSYGSVFLATLKNPRSRHGYLPPVMAVKSAEFSDSATIQKEREVLSNVKGCPSIIRCYGDETTTGGSGEMVYNLLLEYGSGGTLADLISKSAGHGLGELNVRFYTKSILLGINHVHDCGYVHCDLKPENILLLPNSGVSDCEFRAKIGDFGLAKRVRQRKKMKLEPYWRGTPLYLSPESVIDGIQEPPSDIWALGCIVLEMLTGKPPWNEKRELNPEDFLKMIEEGQDTPKIPNDLSKDAKNFLKRCFVRKSMYRLTAEMLLNHPFVEGLADFDDSGKESGEFSDEIDSFLVVSGSDYEELDYSSSSDCWSLESGEEEFASDGEDSIFSDDDEVEEEVVEEEVVEELKNADLKKATVNSRSTKPYPVAPIVRAGA